MQIRLVRKLAESVDGIDVSDCHIGDVVDLPDRQADLLIAEGWAVARRSMLRRFSVPSLRAEAADKPRRTTDRLRTDRGRKERRQRALHEQRRAEDRFREELHDSRARTITAHPSETT